MAATFSDWGDGLATKRHKVHKKVESSIQQIIRFVAFVIFVASKNVKVREGAQFEFSQVQSDSGLPRLRIGSAC